MDSESLGSGSEKLLSHWSSGNDTVPIIRVHHKDQPLGVLIVMPPQGADLVLSPHVPHSEGDVLVLHRLHVETEGGRE